MKPLTSNLLSNCSCNSCSYKDDTEQSSINPIQGSKIDKYYMRNIPRRQQKLLQKLVKTRAVYDSIRTKIISDESSDNTILLAPYERTEPEETETGTALNLVKLIDKGSAGQTALSDCCSCCICDLSKDSRKHKGERKSRKYRHQYADPRSAKYGESIVSESKEHREDRIKNKKRRKHIISSDSCTCILRSMGLLNSAPKASIKKVRASQGRLLRENTQNADNENRKLKHVYHKMESGMEVVVRESNKKIKRTKTKIGDGVRNSLENVRRSRKKMKAEIKKSIENYHKIVRNVIPPTKAMLELDKEATELVDLYENTFHTKLRLSDAYGKEEKLKNILNKWKCDFPCSPEECVPEECFEIKRQSINSIKSKRKRRSGRHESVQFKINAKKKKSSKVICDCDNSLAVIDNKSTQSITNINSSENLIKSSEASAQFSLESDARQPDGTKSKPKKNTRTNAYSRESTRNESIQLKIKRKPKKSVNIICDCDREFKSPVPSRSRIAKTEKKDKSAKKEKKAKLRVESLKLEPPKRYDEAPRPIMPVLAIKPTTESIQKETTLPTIPSSPLEKKPQAVRIGSSMSFNIEFYRNKPNNVIDPGERRKVRRHNIRTVTPTQKHVHRKTSISSQIKDPQTGGYNLKRCFCTFKLKARADRYTGQIYNRKKSTPSKVNASLQNNLLPYECEPMFCVPGQCDPIICKNRIIQRYSVINNSHYSNRRTKSSPSLTTKPVVVDSANSPLYVPKRKKSQFYKEPTERRKEHLPKLSPLSVESKLSFNKNKFKGKSSNTAIVAIDTPKNRPKSTIKLKKRGNNSTITQSLTKTHQSKSRSFHKQISNSKTKKFKHNLRRCFCTLKFAKIGNKKHRSQKNSKDISTSMQNISSDAKDIFVEKATGKRGNYRYAGTLEPFECEPGVCIPGECNPYECKDLIKARNKKLVTKISGAENILNTPNSNIQYMKQQLQPQRFASISSYTKGRERKNKSIQHQPTNISPNDYGMTTDRYKLKHKSSSTSDINIAKSRNARVQSIKYMNKQPSLSKNNLQNLTYSTNKNSSIKSFNEPPVREDPDIPSRSAVQIKSTLSFSIEFYKKDGLTDRNLPINETPSDSMTNIAETPKKWFKRKNTPTRTSKTDKINKGSKKRPFLKKTIIMPIQVLYNTRNLQIYDKLKKTQMTDYAMRSKILAHQVVDKVKKSQGDFDKLRYIKIKIDRNTKNKVSLKVHQLKKTLNILEYDQLCKLGQTKCGECHKPTRNFEIAIDYKDHKMALNEEVYLYPFLKAPEEQINRCGYSQRVVNIKAQKDKSAYNSYQKQNVTVATQTSEIRGDPELLKNMKYQEMQFKAIGTGDCPFKHYCKSKPYTTYRAGLISKFENGSCSLKLDKKGKRQNIFKISKPYFKNMNMKKKTTNQFRHQSDCKLCVHCSKYWDPFNPSGTNDFISEANLWYSSEASLNVMENIKISNVKYLNYQNYG